MDVPLASPGMAGSYNTFKEVLNPPVNGLAESTKNPHGDLLVWPATDAHHVQLPDVGELRAHVLEILRLPPQHRRT